MPKRIKNLFICLGLVSDGGVHSHINHLKAIVDICKAEGLKDVFIHAFTDGRDCDPKSGLGFIKELQEHLGINRWQNCHRKWPLLCHGQGQTLGKSKTGL